MPFFFINSTVKLVWNIIKWIVAFFFASTILAVLAYRFIPVYVTPLMVIRTFEQAADGKTLSWHHRWTPLKDISKHMPVAVMASEDQRFLEHHGFDFEAIEEAVEHNKTAKRKRGASTITQQTAKNVFLWPGRSWLRKGLEAYFTVLIELIWSKERIMEVYLNSIEMGDGIYGTYSVAKHHFGKLPSELTRSECELIAVTLPNPRRFSSKNPSSYMKRRQARIEKEMRNIKDLCAEGAKEDKR